MKKSLLPVYLAVVMLIGAVCFVACSKEEGDSPSIDENTIVKKIKIVDLKSRIEAEKKLQNKVGDSAVADFWIVTWSEWGRASRNCDGWGLCNANWFPGEEARLSSDNEKGSLLKFDNEKEKYYLDILLAEKVPSDISSYALTFKIDSDFELNAKKIIGQDLTFKKGNYIFNSSLGDFGGYRIYLD